MNVKEIRLARLGELLREHGGSKVNLARALDKAPAQVSQWFNGVRTITEDSARGIEKTLGYPRGWMDTLGDAPRVPDAQMIFAFLQRKYVQHSDERQRAMRLQYMTAETHDLAEELARWLAIFSVQAVAAPDAHDDEQAL